MDTEGHMKLKRRRRFRLGLGPPIFFILYCILSTVISICINKQIDEVEVRSHGAVDIDLP